MERKEFLQQLGLTGAAIFTSYCLGGCTKDNNSGGGGTPPPSDVDFTLNLADAANAALNNPGGFIYRNGIIVARTLSGTFIAVSQACTHQGATVEFQANTNRLYCPAHGSLFQTNGTVVTGPASAPLRAYNTSLTGNNLRIFS